MQTHRLQISSRSMRVAGFCGWIFLLSIFGCDKASHENIDKWRGTEKGPGKLAAALQDSDLNADLRAHAAHNLILLGKLGETRDTIEKIPEAIRNDVMEKLAERLWQSAQFKQGQGELDAPSAIQTESKDALVELRKFGSPKTREQIDQNLVDWLTGGYFEGRVQAGRINGKQIIQTAGRAAAPKLLDAAKSILAKPPNADGSRAKLGDELLWALALTADPAAAGFLLEVTNKTWKDEELPVRAMTGLWRGLTPEGRAKDPVGDPGEPSPNYRVALLPHIKLMTTMLQNEGFSGLIINDLADLISAVGKPECVSPLLDLVSYKRETENYRWMGTQKAIRCGGLDVIVEVLNSIPTSVVYDRVRLEKYVWQEVWALEPKNKIAEMVRPLVTSKSWVAKVSAIEILGGLKLKATAADDAEAIMAQSKDSFFLKNWRGKGVPNSDSSIGAVAKEVATKLAALAKE